MKYRSRIFLCAMMFLCALGEAVAQSYPNKPIRWVVPYAAGGGADVLARLLAEPMGKSLGQRLIIDNRPGANSVIAAEEVARAQPDGYTIGTANTGTLSQNQFLYPKLPYDPARDFSIIGGYARFPYWIIVNAASPAKSLSDLLAMARKEPGRLTYGTAGSGSPGHVAMELLQQRVGISLIHVPYKGGSPGMLDLIAGRIDFMMLDTVSPLAHVKAGNVRPLAVAYGRRLQAFPSVPTFAEAGVPNFEVYTWNGLITAVGTPRTELSRLTDALLQAANHPDIKQRFLDMGVEPAPMPPEKLASVIEADTKLWRDVISKAKIKLEQ